MDRYTITDPETGTKYTVELDGPPTTEQVKTILLEGRKKYPKLAVPTKADQSGTIRGDLGGGLSYTASPYDPGAQDIADRRAAAFRAPGLDGLGLSSGEDEYVSPMELAAAQRARGNAITTRDATPDDSFLQRVLLGLARQVEGARGISAYLTDMVREAGADLLAGRPVLGGSGYRKAQNLVVGSVVPYPDQLEQGLGVALEKGPGAGAGALDAALRRLWQKDPLSFTLQGLPLAAGAHFGMKRFNAKMGARAEAAAALERGQAAGLDRAFMPGELEKLAGEVRDSAIGSGWSESRANRAGAAYRKMIDGKKLDALERQDLGELIGLDVVDRATAGGISAAQRVAGSQVTWQDIISLPKGFKAGFDLSPMLRQGAPLGGFVAVRNPRGYVAAWRDMFKSALPGDFVKGKGEVNYKAAKAEIENSPEFAEARDHGLRLSGWDGNEVGLGGELVRKIPGLGMSERAFNAGLDRLRIEAYSTMRRALGNSPGSKDLNDIADFINIATGYGNPLEGLERAQGAALKVHDAARLRGKPKIAGAASGAVSELERLKKPLGQMASTGLFSARNTAARFQYLDPVRYYQMTPAARKVALQAMAFHAAAVGTIMGVSIAAGATVSGDFTSGDFGKVKIGNTRYEVTGGNARQIRLMLALGYEAAAPGSKERPVGKTKAERLERMEKLLRQYFRNSMAPIPGAAHDTVFPEFTPVGAPESTKDRALDLVTPLMARDIYEGWQLEGAGGAAKVLPGAFGAGVQQYESKIYGRGGRRGARGAALRSLGGR